MRRGSANRLLVAGLLCTRPRRVHHPIMISGIRKLMNEFEHVVRGEKISAFVYRNVVHRSQGDPVCELITNHGDADGWCMLSAKLTTNA
jgi:hypothetical protein